MPSQVVLAKSDKAGYVGGFNAQYYDHASGARVFSAGTINWGWGLRRDDLGQWGSISLETKVGTAGATVKSAVSGITTNVLNKLLETPVAIPPLPVPDGGPPTVDAGSPDSGATTYDTAPWDSASEDLGVPPDDDKRDSATARDALDRDGGSAPFADGGLGVDPEAGEGNADEGQGGSNAGCGCTAAGHESTAPGAIGVAILLLGLSTTARRGRRGSRFRA